MPRHEGQGTRIKKKKKLNPKKSRRPRQNLNQPTLLGKEVTRRRLKTKKKKIKQIKRIKRKNVRER